MKKQKGITLITLTITIIIMLIIASITLNIGTGLIKEAKLQDLVTNMLLIQAKTKEGVEEVNFKKANVTNQEEIEKIKSENLIGKVVSGSNIEVEGNGKLEDLVTQVFGTTDNCYYLAQEDLEHIGIKDIDFSEYGYFVIKYDIENIAVDIMNTRGYKGEYKLDKLVEMQGE
ncbi:MAG: hypothetical protein HFJ55_01815 [Clostridia bacterium]|nr:hypothetical protein [Clostridia bacterium]